MADRLVATVKRENMEVTYRYRLSATVSLLFKVHLIGIFIVQESIRPTSSTLTSETQCGDPRFEDVPCSTITPLGEYAEYFCAVPNGLIFWFVNETSPHDLREDSKGLNFTVTVHFNQSVNGTGETSVLRVLATKLANNSRIECAVHDFFEFSATFSSPALLLVQGALSPPINVTANLYQRVHFENVLVFVDVKWEEPFESALSIPEEFYINYSSSCLDFHVSVITQYHADITLSHYIVDVCDGFTNCTQTTVANSTEYQHLTNNNVVCGNDTELQIAVRAVSLSGKIGEKSNSTTVTPEMKEDVMSWCHEDTPSSSTEQGSLTIILQLAIPFASFTVTLIILCMTGTVIFWIFRRRKKRFTVNHSEPLYDEPNSTLSGLDPDPERLEKNIAYKTPSMVHGGDVPTAESNPSGAMDKPDRFNTCVGMDPPLKRSQSGTIAVTRDANVVGYHDTEHSGGVSTSTFMCQIPTMNFLATDDNSLIRHSVRNEATSSELVGFSHKPLPIVSQTEETNDTEHIHMEEMSSHSYRERSIIVTPNKAYGSVVKLSIRAQENDGEEFSYPSPVEETVPHVYETVNVLL